MFYFDLCHKRSPLKIMYTEVGNDENTFLSAVFIYLLFGFLIKILSITVSDLKDRREHKRGEGINKHYRIDRMRRKGN